MLGIQPTVFRVRALAGAGRASCVVVRRRHMHACQSRHMHQAVLQNMAQLLARSLCQDPFGRAYEALLALSPSSFVE